MKHPIQIAKALFTERIISFIELEQARYPGIVLTYNVNKIFLALGPGAVLRVEATPLGLLIQGNIKDN
jgi:hypothetical protein